jgi:hypothetical protein
MFRCGTIILKGLQFQTDAKDAADCWIWQPQEQSSPVCDKARPYVKLHRFKSDRLHHLRYALSFKQWWTYAQ